MEECGVDFVLFVLHIVGVVLRLCYDVTPFTYGCVMLKCVTAVIGGCYSLGCVCGIQPFTSLAIKHSSSRRRRRIKVITIKK